MSGKLRPCPAAGGRHSWSFVKNATTSQLGLNFAAFTLRGIYRCANCKTQKYGNFKHATQEQIA